MCVYIYIYIYIWVMTGWEQRNNLSSEHQEVRWSQDEASFERHIRCAMFLIHIELRNGRLCMFVQRMG